MVMFVFLLLATFSLTKAEISVVRNVVLTPKLYEETSTVTISWQAPANLSQTTSQESDLLYEVKYCEINKAETCKTLAKEAATSKEVGGLTKGQIYTYHITPFGKDNEKGLIVEQTFEPKTKATCKTGLFSCEVSDTCLDPIKLCDGLQGCGDNSDESGFAKCALPAKPNKIQIESITEDSFVVKYTQLAPKDRTQSYKIELLDEASDNKLTKSASHQKFFALPKRTTVIGLKPSTTYSVRISGVNAVGQGPFSKVVKATTLLPKGEPVLKVTGVTLTPKLLSESSAVIVKWDVPLVLGNSQEADLTYNVSYCLINKEETCKIANVGAERIVEIADLDKTQIYSLHIDTIGTNKEQGTEFDRTFETLKKRTCLPNQFTCKESDKCTKLEYNCNGQSDCPDSSDETADAQCTAPSAKPTEISIVMKKSTGFTVLFEQVHNQHRVTNYIINVVEENSTSTGHNYLKRHVALTATKVSKVIDDLKPGVTYKVRIQATNRVGKGAWSPDITTTTETFGPVLNVIVTAVEFSESTSVKVTWDVPHGEDTSEYTYQVRYCRINKEDTCKLKNVSSDTSAVLTGLTPGDIYQWRVNVLDFNKNSGRFVEDTFKTGTRDVCQATQFTCTTSPKCIDLDKRCNTVSDCGDNSDEKADGGCKKPKKFPTGVKTSRKTTTSYEFTFANLPGEERITAYKYAVRDVIDDEVVQSSQKSHNIYAGALVTIKISNLRAGRKYEIRFSGINLVGEGPLSESTAFTTNDDGTPKTTPGDQTLPTNAPPDSGTSEGMSTGAKAGIAVGIILALVVLIIAVLFLLKQRKKGQERSNPQKYSNGKANGGYEMDKRP